MIKKIKFTKLLHKKLESWKIESPYIFKLGISIPKKKIYLYKVKELIQMLKVGNSITKTLLYSIYYFLRKLYS